MAGKKQSYMEQGYLKQGLLTHTEPFRISRAIATRTGS
jgi:hypothetical protein